MSDHHVFSEHRGNAALLLSAALILGFVSSTLATSAIDAALPEMAVTLGNGGQFAAQIAFGMTALGLTLGALTSGHLLERQNTRVVYLLGMVAFGLSGGTPMVLHGQAVLLISRVIVGLSASYLATTSLSGIVSQYRGNERATLFGLTGATSAVVGLLSTILGGYLTRYGGWRLSFIQYPVFAIGGVCSGFFALRAARNPERSRTNASGGGPGLLAIYSSVLALFTVFGVCIVQLPFLLRSAGLYDPGVRSLILALPVAGSFTGSSVYSVFQRWAGARWTFVLGVSCLLSGVLLWSFDPSLSILGIGAPLLGFFVGLSGPFFYHAVSERAAPGTTSKSLGYLNAVTFFGVFVGPAIATPLEHWLGIRALFLCAACAIFIAALNAIRAFPGQKRAVALSNLEEVPARLGADEEVQQRVA